MFVSNALLLEWNCNAWIRLNARCICAVQRDVAKVRIKLGTKVESNRVAWLSRVAFPLRAGRCLAVF